MTDNGCLHMIPRTGAVEIERQRARLKWKDTIRKKITEIMCRCGVPVKFSDAEQRSISADILQMAACVFNNEGLFIFGRPGVGKTHVAALCVRGFILAMEPVFRQEHGTVPQEVGYPAFSTVADMLLAVRDSFRQKEFSENDILKKYSSAPLVVLDDLGAEKVTEWSAKTLYSVINRRYADNLPLIITSAMNLKELEDRYNAASPGIGSAIAVRISETSKILSLHAARKKAASGRKRRRTDERV
ncbi:MAG: ATP-binding protein [Candidatus Magnetominusculus sp. LBB02]|nr:ATP-binding protein [Candidatus Magnetominusculus sp. LBB02]